jgi:chemotaxis protein methyltransferase CheR
LKLSLEARLRAHELLSDRLGLDCPEHRQADVETAFIEAMRRARIKSPEALLQHLATLPAEAAEWNHLAQRLTIGETYFFRDRAFFEALEGHVLPLLVGARRQGYGRPRLNIWSAGCSSGEEPYSLAIVLDRLLPDVESWDLAILGTDVNSASLETARRALYRPWSLRDTPLSVRDHYFRRRGGSYEVIPEIRRRVRFAPLNLAAAGPPPMLGPVDLLLCRNVLMYLSKAVARGVVGRLRDALAPDGWLVAAAAESWAELFRPLVPVNLAGTILFTGAASAHGQATSPLPHHPPAGESLGTEAPLSTARPRRPGQARTAVPPASEGAAPAPNADRLSDARALADRGQLDEALRACQSALSRNQMDPEAHFLLGTIHQERGEAPEALAALRRALYLAPDLAAAHAAMGHLLRVRGESRRARRHLEAAARLTSRQGSGS